MENCITDVIIGLKTLELHESVTINFQGSKPPIIIEPKPCENLCSMEADLGIPTLFEGINPNAKQVKCPSRKYSKVEQSFIREEIDRLLDEGIIETSNSPWRAQIVVAKKNDKMRLCVDYSQTVNLITPEDAYPMPRIDEMVNTLALYKYFSKYDLKSSYHQVPIREEDKKLSF